VLTDGEHEISDGKRRSEQFDPVRFVPGTDELHRQVVDHGAVGGANPGRTFMA
jgi:hypothetical protein